MGTCLTLDTSLQLFWVLTGSGSNGKGRLMNLLEECLGDYYQAVSPAMLTRKRESANEANEALMALVKARLAVFQEPEAGENIQAGTVKAITGEDTLSSRVNYGKQTKFRPKFKSFLVANDLPATSEATVALFRRIRIVNFPTSFVEEPTLPHERKIDFHLDAKLKAAAPYFIGILIHFYRRLQEEGLNEPSAIRDSTKKYQGDNDVIAIFKEEYLERVLIDGKPSRATAITHQRAKERFVKSFARHPPKTLVDKFLDSFGTPDRTTKSFEQWKAMVGKSPEGTSVTGKYCFKGFFGWRWKEDDS
jgi:P4 family phage/plasmid primase-like protien